MHRPRVKSTSNIQDEEVPSIIANLDYINQVLKWSISDLDRFIALLRARATAEDAYIASLAKITKTHLVPDADAAFCFGDTETTFHKATAQYERSLEQLITSRRGFTQSIHAQIEILGDVKEKQESRRRTVKTMLGQNNTEYINFRTRDIVRLQTKYSSRCSELLVAQNQLQQQVQQQSHQNLLMSDTDSKDSDSGRLSSDEPRPRLSADNDSISSLGDGSAKKAMANFMAQMRTHVVNAATASAAQEVSKQNARCARLATDIANADTEYRDGIRKLETLRRKQIEIAGLSLKQVETVLADKTEASKAAMRDMVLKERARLAEESRLNDYVARAVDDIDSKRDILTFSTEYQKKRFVQPSVIKYRNFHHGEANELLFGSSLVEYANEHKCTVPLIVYKCIEAVERMGGLQKEGIYRISGRQSNVDILKSLFEQNEQGIDLEQTKFDVFTIASVLKVYLRELKEPLFHFGHQTRVEYATLETQARLNRLQSKVASLAKVQRDTLFVLMRHLSNVNKHSKVNKMNLQNLSVVFTPTIFKDRSGNGAPGEWRGDKVFEDMLVYYEPLFRNAEIQSQLTSNTTSAADMNPTGHGRADLPPYHHHPAPPPSQAGGGASTPISANTGMLLTAPLNPSNLGFSSDRQAGYDSHHQQQEQQEQQQQQQSTLQQQRSTSLTTTAVVNNHNGSSPVPQQKIPPRSTSSSSSRNTSPSPPSTTEDPVSLIGMAAMGTVLEPRAAMTTTESPADSGGLRTETRPTITTTVLCTGGGEDALSPISPISPSEGKQKGDGVPPRQDSLRMQVAHQKVQQQQQHQLPPPLPPAISTSPLPTNINATATASTSTKQPSRPSPTGPQTPTIAIGGTLMEHTPSTAVIVETDYAAPLAGEGSGDKHLDEGEN